MNKPSDNGKLTPRERKSIEDTPEFIKKITMWCLKNGFSAAVFFKLLANGMNPFQAKKMLVEKFIGLRTNSIIGNPLYYPDTGENEGNLRFQNASAGLWNVYDFKKAFTLKFGKKVVNFGDGVDFLFFPIEDIVNKDSDKDIETPVGLLDVFHIDHILHFSKMKIQDALDYGAIEEVTYKQAYEKLKVPGWLEDVTEFGIEDKTVYQVTPKGNTLIIPVKKGGDKSPPLPDSKTEKQGNFQPAYA